VDMKVAEVTITVDMEGVERIVDMEDPAGIVDSAVVVETEEVVEMCATPTKKAIAPEEIHAGFPIPKTEVGIAVVVVAAAGKVYAMTGRMDDAGEELHADFRMRTVAVVAEGGTEMTVEETAEDIIEMRATQMMWEDMAMVGRLVRKTAFGRMVYFMKEILTASLVLVLALVLGHATVINLVLILEVGGHLYLKASAGHAHVREMRLYVKSKSLLYLLNRH